MEHLQIYAFGFRTRFMSISKNSSQKRCLIKYQVKQQGSHFFFHKVKTVLDLFTGQRWTLQYKFYSTIIDTFSNRISTSENSSLKRRLFLKILLLVILLKAKKECDSRAWIQIFHCSIGRDVNR